MIYVIYGDEEIFVRRKVDNLIKQYDGNYTRIDGLDNDFNVDTLINDCCSFDLFNNNRLILVDNPYFLIKKIDDKSLEKLENYINNPNIDSDLVLYSYDYSFNSKLKAFKTVSNNAEVIKCDRLDVKNFQTYAKQEIVKFNLNISLDAISVLTNVCKRSATILNQNLNILSNYPDKIDISVIKKLCTSSEENDSFELINAITSKNISKAILLCRKELADTNSIMSIMGLLSSQLRFLYQIAYYDSIGKNRKEIIDITNANEYRLSKAYETLNKLPMNKILYLLEELSLLDIKLKSDDNIPENDRFELFIMEIMKKD